MRMDGEYVYARLIKGKQTLKKPGRKLHRSKRQSPVYKAHRVTGLHQAIYQMGPHKTSSSGDQNSQLVLQVKKNCHWKQHDQPAKQRS